MEIVLTPAIAVILFATPVISAFSVSGNRKNTLFAKKQSNVRLFSTVDVDGANSDIFGSNHAGDTDAVNSLDMSSLEALAEKNIEAKVESEVAKAEKDAIIAIEAMMERQFGLGGMNGFDRDEAAGLAELEAAAQQGAEFFTEKGVEIFTEAKIEGKEPKASHENFIHAKTSLINEKKGSADSIRKHGRASIEKLAEKKVESKCEAKAEIEVIATTEIEAEATAVASFVPANISSIEQMTASTQTRLEETAKSLQLSKKYLKALETSVEMGAVNQVEKDITAILETSVIAKAEVSAEKGLGSKFDMDIRIVESHVELAATSGSETTVSRESEKIHSRQSMSLDKQDIEAIESACELTVENTVDTSVEAQIERAVEADVENRDYQQLQPVSPSTLMQQTPLPTNTISPVKDLRALTVSVEEAVEQASQPGVDLLALQSFAESKVEGAVEADVENREYRQRQPVSTSTFMEQTSLPSSNTISSKDLRALESSVEQALEQVAQLSVDLQVLQISSETRSQRETEAALASLDFQQLQPISPSMSKKQTTFLSSIATSSKDLRAFEESVEQSGEQAAQLSVELQSLQSSAEVKVEGTVEADVESRGYQQLQQVSISISREQAAFPSSKTTTVKDLRGLEASVEMAVEQVAESGVDLQSLQVSAEGNVEGTAEIDVESRDYRQRQPVSASAHMQQTSLPYSPTIPVKDLRALESSVEKVVEQAAQLHVDLQSLQSCTEAKVERETEADIDIESRDYQQLQPVSTSIFMQQTSLPSSNTITSKDLRALEASVDKALEQAAQLGIDLQKIRLSVEAKAERETEADVIYSDYQSVRASTLMQEPLPFSPTIPAKDMHALVTSIEQSVEQAAQLGLKLNTLQAIVEAKVERVSEADVKSHDYNNDLPASTSVFMQQTTLGRDNTASIDNLLQLETSVEKAVESVVESGIEMLTESEANKEIELEILECSKVVKKVGSPSLESDINILSQGPVEEAVETIAEAEVELNVQAQKENEVITNAEIQAELQYPMSVSQPDSSAIAPEALSSAFVSAELRGPGLVGYLDALKDSEPMRTQLRDEEMETKSILSTGSVEEAVETIAEAEVELNVQAQKENEVITNAEIQAELQYPMSVSQPDSEALPPAFVSAELRDPGLVGYDTVDISIPYDAAARNAYEISSKSLAYPEFKVKYEAAAIELVKSKQDTAATADELDDTIDVSIPYDAAARNAYEISSKSIAYPEFKVKYEAAAIELVKSKRGTWRKSGETRDEMNSGRTLVANEIQSNEENVPFPSFSKYLKKRSRKGIEEKADKERAGNEERQWNIKIVEEEKKTRTQRIMEKTQSEGQ